MPRRHRRLQHYFSFNAIQIIVFLSDFIFSHNLALVYTSHIHLIVQKMQLWTFPRFTARRHASAVFAVVVRPSVCLSATSRYCIEATGRIELVVGMEAFFHLSHTV